MNTMLNSEAAKILSTNRRGISKLICKGKLVGVTFGDKGQRCRRVTVESVNRLIAESSSLTTPSGNTNTPNNKQTI